MFRVLLILSAIAAISMSLRCPCNFVGVPATVTDGPEVDPEFCVAKYEMKVRNADDDWSGNQEYDNSLSAESRPCGTPWQNINQDQAKYQCEKMGTGYTLITNDEWMKIAKNIEYQGANWNDQKNHPTGEVEAELNVGHTCYSTRYPELCSFWKYPFMGTSMEASDDDTQACFGYTDTFFGAFKKPECSNDIWARQRRTHVLSNGETLWDFSGNVWEWVDWTVPTNRATREGADKEDFVEINTCIATPEMNVQSFKSLNVDLTSKNLMGMYKSGLDESNTGAAFRGGNYMYSHLKSGIYSLDMSNDPMADVQSVGFRCVYNFQIGDNATTFTCPAAVYCPKKGFTFEAWWAVPLMFIAVVFVTVCVLVLFITPILFPLVMPVYQHRELLLRKIGIWDVLQNSKEVIMSKISNGKNESILATDEL